MSGNTFLRWLGALALLLLPALPRAAEDPSPDRHRLPRPSGDMAAVLPPGEGFEDQKDYLVFRGRRVRLLRRPFQAALRSRTPQVRNPALRSVEPVKPIEPSGPVYHDPELKIDFVCPERILLKVAHAGVLDDILKAFPVTLQEPLGIENAYCLRSGPGSLETANRIAGHPGVEWAEPEILAAAAPTRVPNDPLYPRAWHLNGRRGRGLMAHLAWDLGWGDADIGVAVFDDGIEKGHPDLNISPLGLNLLNDPPTRDPWPPQATASHGTACAGLAGAVGDNALGVIGVAPGVAVVPMRMTNHPDGGSASSKSLGDGILHAAKVADVGTVSIVGMRSNYIEAAIRKAALEGRNGKGFLFFTSSGNNGTGSMTYPSLYEHSISVGASTYEDVKAGYSQWGETGKTVDFLAPTDAPTTDLLGNRGEPGDYLAAFGGTSAATPLAAGVAALILSTNPDLTRAQVLRIMRSTCDKVGGVAYRADGTHPQYGYGRLNAYSALKSLPPYIVFEPRDTAVAFNRGFSHAATARGFGNTFRWQKEIPGPGWLSLADQAGMVLAFNPVLPSHVGRYRFIVTNAHGSDTSRAFALGVNAGGLSARRPGRSAGLGATLSREGNRIRFDLEVPEAGAVRLDLVAPDGKTQSLLAQHLGPGTYSIHPPYRLARRGAYLYRLALGAKVVTGAFRNQGPRRPGREAALGWEPGRRRRPPFRTAFRR